MEKFLVVSYLLSEKTIALSQISSIEPFMMGTKLTLKEMKNGTNVVINTSDSYTSVMAAVERLNSK